MMSLARPLSSRRGPAFRVLDVARAVSWVLTLGLLTASSAMAQGVAPGSDSAAAVRAARDAQWEFEDEHVRMMPQTGASGSGECFATVGRMCVMAGSSRDWWPVPESPAIGRARADLLRALEDAHARAPGDGWILGQRVLYLGEDGRWAAADSLAAAACVAVEAAWCLELRGLALHQLGRFVESEGAFRSALARLGPDSARAWADPGELLDERGRGWLNGSLSGGRADAEAWVWALADPLLLVAGNDQLTQQWARRTIARIRSDARDPHAMSWGSDLEELLRRYGPEIGWERVVNGSLDPAVARTVIGYEDPDSRPLMPPGTVLQDPGAPPSAWIADPRRPRSWYAPSYAAAILPAPGQLVVFPRGDRAVVVGAVALPVDTSEHAEHGHADRNEPRAPWIGRHAQIGLFLLRAGDGSGRPLEVRADTSAGGLALEAPAGRWVVSLEVLDAGTRRAGRMRAGVVVTPHATDEATLSDLLLVDGSLPEDGALEDAVRRALPRDWLRSGEQAGIAWELFGLPRGEILSYRLTLERARPGLLGRAARALRLLRPAPARRLEWEEPGPAAAGPMLRSVGLDLAELETGTWVLRLEIQRSSGAVLVRERTLELRREG